MQTLYVIETKRVLFCILNNFRTFVVLNFVVLKFKNSTDKLNLRLSKWIILT